MTTIIAAEPFLDRFAQHRTHPSESGNSQATEDLQEWGLVSFDDRSAETPIDHLFDLEDVLPIRSRVQAKVWSAL